MNGHWDPETLDKALDVLGDLPQWQLAAPRWEQVGAILDRMRLAYERGDGEDLREATADLEVHGPVRANRIGTKDVEGPDRSLLERQSNLEYTLGRAAPGGPANPDGEHGERSPH